MKTLSAFLLAAIAAATPLAAQQPRAVRPDKDLGATRVTLTIGIIDFIEIDALDESFDIDFVLSARWKDERLAWSGDDETSTMIYHLDEVWHPRLTILNARDLSPMFPRELEVTRDGTVHFLQRLQGSLTASLDLADFPFDRQRLDVRLVDVRYSPQEIAFEIDEARIMMLPSATLAGWQIQLAPATIEPLLMGQRQLAGLTFGIEADREEGHFIFTTLVPLSLIVLMAWMVFWIDPSLMPSQVGLSTAAVFSLMAYRTAVRLSLPAVSYLTRADIFILGTTGLVFGALVHAIATGRLAKTGREALAKQLDRWARWVYVVLMVIISLASLVW